MAVALNACGAGTGTQSRSANQLGPASAQLQLAGTDGLAGSVTSTYTRCFVPTLEGLSITIVGHPAGDNSLKLSVSFAQAAVIINLNNASSNFADYAERNFRGTGVTGFDPTRGVTVNSSLAEPSVFGPGSLGRITSIRGHVDCGNQTPGTSSIILVGDTNGGHVAGALSHPRVECVMNSQGRSASIAGLTRIGAAVVLIDVTIGRDFLDVDVSSSATAGDELFLQSTLTVASVNAIGVHVDGVTADQQSLQTPPNSLHVSGDATCGSSIKG